MKGLKKAAAFALVLCVCGGMGLCALGAQSGLAIKNITGEQFVHSVHTPRRYDLDGGIIRAGIVPHHTTAASMISGFFAQAARHAAAYDTVVIVAPNHKGDLGDIILADQGWDIGGGVPCDTAFVTRLLAANGLNVIVDNQRLEDDHSASILIPYVHHYLPDTRVVTVLVSRSLGYDSVGDFARLLLDTADALERSVLLVCSIDFSHFLPPHEAMQRDRVTRQALLARDYPKIYSLCNHYIDSPAALMVFLMTLEAHGLEPQIVDNAEASVFLGYAIDETTSYFVVVGAQGE
jgi:AmmeMemoRadiSam system protein B